jgi:3-oxoacyl-[acyl-carrier protein] reductase
VIKFCLIIGVRRVDMEANISGRVAFVAGSSAGIGKAIALKLAKNGADIALNGRNPASATKVTKQIEELGRKVVFEKADITDYQEIKQAVDDTITKLGKIDILIASGGVTGADFVADFFEKTDPTLYGVYAARNWLPRLYCVRAVLDHMIERRAGKIIIITTDAGRWPTPAECLAGATGAATIMATKVLAQELGRWQIRVNAISLSPIKDTPGFDYVIQRSPSLAHVFDKALAKQPFPVTAEDVAEAALFFASDDSNAITGQILSINGGLCFPG